MLDRNAIARLIPHGGNMVLLDKVNAWSDTEISCTTFTHLRADNPLRRRGRLASVCGVEYGAQAMAVHGGLVDGRGRPGFLASLRHVQFKTDRLDNLDSELAVSARLLHRESNGAVYAFTVGANGEVVVSGQATVFLK